MIRPRDTTLYFDIERLESKNRHVSVFTEKQRHGRYARGGTPITYRYIHESGNMTMLHDELYARREILARSASGQKAGAKPALPNDEPAALLAATRHLKRYRGDGKTYVQRYVDNRTPETRPRPPLRVVQ